MRRGRVFIYLALIIILLVVAAFVVYQRFFNVPTTSQEEMVPQPTPVVELVDVIVVTQSIPRGGVLDETVLGTIPIPREMFIQGMFSDMAEVVGRQAKFDLDAGIPLTASMLVESAEQLSATGSIAALSIPAGKVAVSIPINRLSSVSYAPRPGDHVSVIATMMFVDLDSEFQSELPNQVGGVLAPGAGVVIGSGTGAEAGTELNDSDKVNNLTARVVGGGAFAIQGRTELDPILNELIYVLPSESQRPRMVSQMVLGDVIVLRLGDFKTPEEEAMEKQKEEQAAALEEQQQIPQSQQQGQPGEQAGQAQEQQAPKPPDVITLIVDPQDAVTLNYLIFSGAQLTLALRSAGDTGAFATEPATLQFVMQQYNIPAPAKLPFGLEPRIDQAVMPQLENDVVPAETR